MRKYRIYFTSGLKTTLETKEKLNNITKKMLNKSIETYPETKAVINWKYVVFVEGVK